MGDFVLPPPRTPSLAVAKRSARFGVGRIFCVGRNYAAHAREMGGSPEREPPFFFTKPADTLTGPGPVAYPPDTEELHHEVELVIALGDDGYDVPVERALSLVWGYAVGNDLTRRDRQREAKAHRRPWALAKGFDGAAVVGPLHPATEVGHPEAGAIRLSVDGDQRQAADLSELIWRVPEIVSILSRSLTLRSGDLIMTGTPAGVGPLRPGQRCVAAIDGLGAIATEITERR